MNNSPNNYTERRSDIVSTETLDRVKKLEMAFKECSERIGAKADEMIGEHRAIKEMRAKLSELYESFCELNEIVKGAIGNGDQRLKGHDSDIEELRLRVTGVENALNEIKSQISQIEHITRSNTESINNMDSKLVNVESLCHQIMRQNTTTQETFNAFANYKSSSSITTKQAAKSPVTWGFSLGSAATIYALLTAFHYFKTGQVLIFGG